MLIKPIRRATAADTDLLITLLDEARDEIGIAAHVDLRSQKARDTLESWCVGKGKMDEEVWVTTDKSGAMVLLKASRTEDVENREPVVLYHPTVHYIVVAANLRHRGIGRKLLEHAESLYDNLTTKALKTNAES